MSRIGKIIYKLTDGVTVTEKDSVISVKGPKGELSIDLDPRFNVVFEDDTVRIDRPNNEKSVRSKHGMYSSLLGNAIKGVSQGYEQNLELVGIGYRVQLQGKDLKFSLGFSHEVIFEAPEDITFTVDGQTKIKVSGIDKQLVGQSAANIQALKRPDAYKGKGIRFANQRIVLKPGKSVKK